MNFDGHTKLYGFLAHPAQHSLSPLMHNLSFQENQLNACYLAFDINPKEFSKTATNLKNVFGGVNLSMPFKKQIIPYLDHLTPRAHRIQAVNTVRNQNGELFGDSTDGAGLFADLIAKGYQLSGKTVTILGAGGAGRAIIAAADDYDIKKVFVCKRPNQTFIEIEKWLQKIDDQSVTEYQLIDYSNENLLSHCLKESQLLINATNVGMDTHSLPLNNTILDNLSPSHFVYDIIYQPLQTPLLAFATERGCNCCNGIGMLLWQGALAFEFWTNKKMPVADVKKALLIEIERRRS